MPSMLVDRPLLNASQALPWWSWAVLLVATGCGRTALNPPAGGGGATSTGGAAGQGVGGNAGGTESTGGTAFRGGTLGFGGTTEAGGGVTGSGGAVRTGGVGGVGGIVGIGGMFPTGGTVASGGTGGTAGTAGSSPVFGMACTTDADCPSGSTCCDGSDESCDGTRLPSGDGTDPGEFVVSSDGLTVTDTITGLVWQRDGSGTRAGCTTDPSNLTCTQAEAESYCRALSLGGFSGWRLPGEHELHTIVDLANYSPTIDTIAFPNTAIGYYWTSSSEGLASGTAWAVYFHQGGSTYNALSTLQNVRCATGSRCYPTSRFVASNGLVSDTLTNLVWQQEASATTMTWVAAQSYCSVAGVAFRLPTLKELESLVDVTVTSGSTITQTAFPNTPQEDFLTSSPYAGSSGYSWFVSFYWGWSNVTYVAGNYLGVRCVR